MTIYKKYERQIEKEETNNIYVYIGTYRTSGCTIEEFEEGYPLEIETEINDPRATYRYYYNLEGLWTEAVDIKNCEKFESTHKILHVDNFCKTQEEFVVTTVKENQEKAINKVLQKYYI